MIQKILIVCKSEKSSGGPEAGSHSLCSCFDWLLRSYPASQHSGRTDGNCFVSIGSALLFVFGFPPTFIIHGSLIIWASFFNSIVTGHQVRFHRFLTLATRLSCVKNSWHLHDHLSWILNKMSCARIAEITRLPFSLTEKKQLFSDHPKRILLIHLLIFWAKSTSKITKLDV